MLSLLQNMKNCMLCGKKMDQGNGAMICRKCGHMPKGKSWGDEW